MSRRKKPNKLLASLGLGSNLGDRFAHIQFGIDSLESMEGIHIVRVSSVYQSEAHVLNPAKSLSDYLNAVCLVETSLSADSLLKVCLDIEKKRGRIRSAATRWESRTLDIDLLHFGGTTIDRPNLIVPHPRLTSRRFVLLPLFEIAPDLKIPPPIDRTVQYLLEHCSDDSSVTLYTEGRAETKTE